jgi:hypothetical protein
MQSLPATFPRKTFLRSSSVASKTVRKREEMLYHWLRTLVGKGAQEGSGDKWQEQPKLQAAAEAVRLQTCQWLLDGAVDARAKRGASVLFQGRRDEVGGEKEGEKEEKTSKASAGSTGSSSSKSHAIIARGGQVLRESRQQQLAEVQQQNQRWESMAKVRRGRVEVAGRKIVDVSVAVLSRGVDVFKFSNRKRSVVGTLKQRRAVWVETNITPANGSVTFIVKWCKSPREKHEGSDAGGQDGLASGAVDGSGGGGSRIVWKDREASSRFSIVAASRTLNLEALDKSALAAFVNAFERVRSLQPQMVALVEAVTRLEEAQARLSLEWANVVVALGEGGASDSDGDAFALAKDRMWPVIVAGRAEVARCRNVRRGLLEGALAAEEGEAPKQATAVLRAWVADATKAVIEALKGDGGDCCGGAKGIPNASLIERLQVVTGDQRAENLREALIARGR